MRVYLRVAPPGEITPEREMEVEGLDTVATLRRKAAVLTGVHPQYQRLILFGVELLDDAKTAADHNIKPEAVIELKPLPMPTVVSLNVGGTVYSTQVCTLTRQKGSRLAQMFDGLEAHHLAGSSEGVPGTGISTIFLPRDHNGSFVIDRDGPSFRHVLNYLRHEGPTEPPLPLSDDARSLLAVEAEYFQLPELAWECRRGGRMRAGRSAVRDLVRTGGNLSGQEFAGADLSNLLFGDNTILWRADLTRADLRNSDLSRCCNFEGADLAGANLSGAKVTAQQVLAASSIQGANLSGLDLAQQDLSNRDLSSCNLSRCNLSGCDLSGVVFTDAVLEEALLDGAKGRLSLSLTQLVSVASGIAGFDLSGCDLSSQNLSNRDLSGCNLSTSDLSSCNLSHCNLSGCDLTGAVFTDAILEEALLDGAQGLLSLSATQLLSVASGIAGSDLSDFDLSGQDLSSHDLSCCKLDGADFTGSNLRGANLRRARVTAGQILAAQIILGTNLSGLDLSQHDFSNRDLSNCDLSRCNFDNAKLAGANLSGAKLTGTKLGTATGLTVQQLLLAANLQGAELHGLTATTDERLTLAKVGAFVDALDLSGRDLSHQDLSNCNLSECTLTDCDLRGANLSGVMLQGARLRGARMESPGTNLEGITGEPADMSEEGVVPGARVLLTDERHEWGKGAPRTGVVSTGPNIDGEIRVVWDDTGRRSAYIHPSTCVLLAEAKFLPK